MNGNPPVLISVIVPVYNRGRFLAAALDSALAQPRRPLEIIVVDDGSEDDSRQIARSYPDVRLIEQSHAGVAAARNIGVRAARGELLAFLDSDDIWTPDKLAIQAGYMLAHRTTGFTLAGLRNFVEPGEAPSWCTQKMLEDTMVGVGLTMMVWTWAFDAVGPFDPSYDVGEDVDWVLRACEAGVPMAALDEVVLHRRLHATNVTRDPAACGRELLRLTRQSVRRKRAAATASAQTSAG